MKHLRKLIAVAAFGATNLLILAGPGASSVSAVCVNGSNGSPVGDSGIGYETYLSDSCTNQNNYYSGRYRLNAASGCIQVKYEAVSSGNVTTSCTSSTSYITSVNNLYDSNANMNVRVTLYSGGTPVWGGLYGNTGF